MEIEKALESAKRWASTARAMEKIARSGGYRFMASENGNEAEVLETLIAAIEERKEHTHEHEHHRPDPSV